MSKPLTTLGDAIAAKGGNWRADMRANDINRRPPPSSHSGPDRGYVEQPAERRDPPPPRRREETPVLRAPVALIRPQMPAPSEPPPPVKAEHETLLSRPAPPTAPEPPVEVEMPKAKPLPEGVKSIGADGRKMYHEEYRVKLARAFLDERAQDPTLTYRVFAARHEVEKTVFGNWVRAEEMERAKAEKTAKRMATLHANKAAAAAAAAPVSQPLPPPSAPLASAPLTSGGRSVADIVADIAAAKHRLEQLKAELMAAL